MRSCRQPKIIKTLASPQITRIKTETGARRPYGSAPKFTSAAYSFEHRNPNRQEPLQNLKESNISSKKPLCTPRKSIQRAEPCLLHPAQGNTKAKPKAKVTAKRGFFPLLCTFASIAFCPLYLVFSFAKSRLQS